MGKLVAVHIVGTKYQHIHRNKDQVVESHVGWDMGTVGHDPEVNLPIVGAAVVVGTI